MMATRWWAAALPGLVLGGVSIGGACGGIAVVDPDASGVGGTSSSSSTSTGSSGGNGPTEVSFRACHWPTAVVGLTIWANIGDRCTRFDVTWGNGDSVYPDLTVPSAWQLDSVRGFSGEGCNSWSLPADDGQPATDASGAIVIDDDFPDTVGVADVVVWFGDEVVEIGSGSAMPDGTCAI
jgi:hypothetical protein